MRRILIKRFNYKWSQLSNLLNGFHLILFAISFETSDGFLFLLPYRGMKRKYRSAFMGAVWHMTQAMRITYSSPALSARLYLSIKRATQLLAHFYYGSISSWWRLAESQGPPIILWEPCGVCLHGADSVRRLAKLHQANPGCTHCSWPLQTLLCFHCGQEGLCLCVTKATKPLSETHIGLDVCMAGGTEKPQSRPG